MAGPAGKYHDGQLAFFYHQLFWKVPPLPQVDLKGKTYVITGSNSGIGFVLSKQIASLGGAIVMAVRNVEKGEAAKAEILKELPESSVDVRYCDLENFDSVRAFADALVKEKESRKIAALVLNAGLLSMKWTTSPAGYERTIQVNVLSNALLSLLLLPLLMEQGSANGYIPRIVMVSSEVHRWTPFKERKEEHLLQALSDPAKYDVGDRYHVAKLLNVLWTLALAKRVDPTKVKVCLTAPGFIKTGLLRELPRQFVVHLAEKALARSPEEGARMLANATFGAPDKEVHGSYYFNGRVVPHAKYVASEEGVLMQDKIWNEVGDVLNHYSPGVLASVETPQNIASS